MHSKIIVWNWLCHAFFSLELIVFSVELYGQKLIPSEDGIYHGVFADFGAFGDEVSSRAVLDFEATSMQPLTWAYFSNPFKDGKIEFPLTGVKAANKADVLPYIRMMPWSRLKEDAGADPIFSMQSIIDGKFDIALKNWGFAAKNWKKPLLVEFGPEANGDWFPWNGRWNGGGTRGQYGDPNLPDGPERFRDAYRHIIDLFRSLGIDNITWVFHIDSARLPHTWWNQIKYYYPGDEYIDWIGISVFGAQLPSHHWSQFSSKLAGTYEEVEKIAPSKPILIAEFAVIESPGNPDSKPEWLADVFDAIYEGIFPKIKGICYWNSFGYLQNGRANMRITSSPNSLAAYQNGLKKLQIAPRPTFNKPYQSQPGKRPYRKKVYRAASISHIQGATISHPSFEKIAYLDQLGGLNNWNKYWDIVPVVKRYSIELIIPTDFSTSFESAKWLLVTNSRGFPYSKQKIHFDLWDDAQKKYVNIGTNKETKDWQWSELNFPFDPNQFLKNHQLKIRIATENALENFNLDYLALEVYYGE